MPALSLLSRVSAALSSHERTHTSRGREGGWENGKEEASFCAFCFALNTFSPASSIPFYVLRSCCCCRLTPPPRLDESNIFIREPLSLSLPLSLPLSPRVRSEALNRVPEEKEVEPGRGCHDHDKIKKSRFHAYLILQLSGALSPLSLSRFKARRPMSRISIES